MRSMNIKMGTNTILKRRALGIPLLFLLLIMITGTPVSAQLGTETVSGELIVGIQPGATSAVSQALSATAQGFGGQVIDQIPEISAVMIKVPEGRKQSTMSAVQSMRDVNYVEPNYQAEMMFQPDDSKWDEQWGPSKVDAPKAWDLAKGSKDILVAVLDTGLDYTHPDLEGNYDRDSYDYVHDDDDPYPVGDGIGGDRGVPHGTHVAGIIAAEIDNDRGVAGLAQVSVMAIRVLNDEGKGSYWNIAKGIVYAANAGVKIINLSLGGRNPGKIMEAAVEFAQTAGCLVIAAAGNTGERGVGYPARYETVIAVSATDQNDELASFSSYGPEVELAAPGVKILSTIPGNRYVSLSGTSMSAPHVVGIAALIWSVNPKLTAEQVRKILCDTADDLGSAGRDEEFGYGRVNAYNAVKAAKKTVGGASPSPSPPTPEPSVPSAPLTLEVDKGCGLFGSSYQVGEKITISYAVAEEATVKLYRVGYSGTPELLATRATSAGVKQSLSLWAESAGVETIVIQAQTHSGQVLTQACTYSIGGISLSKAQIRIDRGCGASYRIGDPITISVVVDEGSLIKIIDFASDGSVSTILERHAHANETVTLQGQVVGPAGEDTLVIRVETNSGLVLTDACSLIIAE